MAEALRSLPPFLAGAASAAVPAWINAQVSRLAPDLFGQEPAAFGQGSEEQTRLSEAVACFLTQLAGQEPLLLIFEDLHWASDSTLHLWQ